MTGRAAAVTGSTRPERSSFVPPLGIEVKLSSLAGPPSPAEMLAIELGIERALRTLRPGLPTTATAEAGWRFSGRWWRQRPAPHGAGLS
ncbi:MAG TPA: hypothetical protein VEJ84_20615 [Acidimicrobiales bacterium]|nr:hypothetical protein [Acidimicrobiales bacterium]